MDTTFNPGDVVRLKSGGPAMTVESVTEKEASVITYCIWFDGPVKYGASFNAVVIEKVPTGSGNPVANH